MPNIRFPRSGSMQFWPRKRAKSPIPKVGLWPAGKETQALGFPGYKVGMTHILIKRQDRTPKKNLIDVSIPVTIIECPPIKIMGARFYKKDGHELKVVGDVLSKALDKELKRTLDMPKKEPMKIEDIKDFDEARLIVHTQPSLTGIGKKRPEIFEMGIGGNKDDQVNYIKENLGKELKIADIFKPGAQIDAHAVTKGKGFQGPVKRFGIKIRAKKSEKTKRGPGSLGGWKGQGHVMYRVPHAGQTGYHLRTEYNKQILKISDSPKEINPKGGFIHYGLVKNTFLLVKGSVAGATKRMLIFTNAQRPAKNVSAQAPEIIYTSLDSKQG